ncbi:hypothetical protein FQA39_LY17848 [Lamprigera yunnana]|nr:hypothetical protein FQA39_LY17848 [Lamprigera yunnana]
MRKLLLMSLQEAYVARSFKSLSEAINAAKEESVGGRRTEFDISNAKNGNKELNKYKQHLNNIKAEVANKIQNKETKSDQATLINNLLKCVVLKLNEIDTIIQKRLQNLDASVPPLNLDITQLQQTKQGNLNIDEYGRSIESLMADLTIAQAGDNEEAIATFREQEVRTITLARSFKSLSEAINAAKEESVGGRRTEFDISNAKVEKYRFPEKW